MSPAQSAFARHVLPSAHLVGHEPPQSMSVSVPFFTPSTQVGAWQMFPVHTPLGHIPPATHSTQVDIPLQTAPPIWLHTVPGADAGFDGTPALQRSSVH